MLALLLLGLAHAGDHELTVAVDPEDSGIVTGGPVYCDDPPCIYDLPGGTALDLSATINEPWVFDHWEGCDAVTEDVCSLTLDGDRTVTTVSLEPEPDPPDIDVDPEEHDFGEIEVGQHSESLQITVTNLGESLLTLGTVTNSDTAFALTDACSDRSLITSATCSMWVEYRAWDAQEHVGVIGIPSDDPDEPLFEVELSGQGVEPTVEPLAGISLSTDAIDFEAVPVGEVSGWEGVTVESTGEGPLSITGLQLDAGDDADFEMDGSACQAGPLEPGSTCDLLVRFTPRSGGSKQTWLWVSSNDQQTGSLTVELTGGGGCGCSGTGAAGAPLWLALVVCRRRRARSHGLRLDRRHGLDWS